MLDSECTHLNWDFEFLQKCMLQIRKLNKLIHTSLPMLQIQCKFNARNTSREEDDVCWGLPQSGSVCLFDMPSPSSHSPTCQIYGNL